MLLPCQVQESGDQPHLSMGPVSGLAGVTCLLLAGKQEVEQEARVLQARGLVDSEIRSP